jgi:hypothetical protein
VSTTDKSACILTTEQFSKNVLYQPTKQLSEGCLGISGRVVYFGQLSAVHDLQQKVDILQQQLDASLFL